MDVLQTTGAAAGAGDDPAMPGLPRRGRYGRANDAGAIACASWRHGLQSSLP